MTDKKVYWYLETEEVADLINLNRVKLYISSLNDKNGTYRLSTDIAKALPLNLIQLKNATGDDWKVFRDHVIYDPGCTGNSVNENLKRSFRDKSKAPSHYMGRGMETIKTIRASMTSEQYQGFCMGNILKYLGRDPFKDAPVADIVKARDYIDFLLEEVKDVESR